MSNKQSFVLYTSFYEPIKSLPNEELGLLFRAIFEFKESGECNTEALTPSSLMAFNFIKNQFAVDDAKYAKRAEANRNNGLKGGRPITQPNPNNPVGYNKTQITQPNPNDNVNVNDKDNVKKERVTSVTLKKENQFEEFWKEYPKNNGSKKTAGEKYESAIRSGATDEQIRAGCRAYADFVRAEGTERKYIAHAATWLQQRRWEIEYFSDSKPSKPSGWQSESDKLIEKVRNGEFNPRGNGAVYHSGNPALPNPSQLREDIGQLGNDSEGLLAIPSAIQRKGTD